MPRNVRNFWIELNIDGKKTQIATGPIRKDGGFSLSIKMRDRGEILRAGTITGDVLPGERLSLVADLRGEITTVQTAR